jgi:hypothetical protein
MSAKIIQFVPRPRRDRGVSLEPAPSWSPWRVDELAMDHADTAPSEYAPPVEECRADIQTDREA